MTAPATPTPPVTALDAIEGDMASFNWHDPADAKDAFATVAALCEAALEYTSWRPMPAHPGSERLKQAAAAYRAWPPAPATVTSGDSGGSGGSGGGEGE